MKASALLTPLALLAAACAHATSPDVAPGDVSLAIANVTVVDVRTGALVPGRTILIHGDTIVAVTDAGVALPSGVRVVDATGRYAIPGLWDMHVHVLWQDSVPETLLPRFVAAGITGVRDMGGTAQGLADARRLQREAIVPRIVASGPLLDGPQPVDPSISFAVADSAAAVAAVDSLHALGADFVKVYTLLPADALRAAAARAAQLGLAVAGHVPGELSVPDGARAGMRSIEHLREEIAVFCTRADSIACEPTIDALRGAPVWQTPTLVVIDAKTRMREAAFADPAEAASMPAGLRDLWRSIRESRLDRPEAYWAQRCERWLDALWLTRRLHGAGMPILAGSDTPVLFTYPGSSLHRELELLVEAGLRPADALRAATLEPARYLGREDRMGPIEAGRVADIVLLGANPLDSIRATRDVAGVVLRGEWLDRGALDRLER